MLIISPDPGTAPRLVALDRAPELAELKDALGGGYLEAIPGFDNIIQDGLIRPCLALCNEEGKLQELPINHQAQTLWVNALARRHGTSDPRDILVGPVVILSGDKEFMAEL
jgi:hypothetical protein